MRAIVQTSTERGGVELQERDEPTPGPEEVLVQVHSAGLCGSDAHAYTFVPGYQWISVPRVMGHEYAGRVVDVGESVTRVEPGDEVVERPIHECGDCFQCTNGQSNVCRNFEITGFHYDGAWREYTTVHERYLLKVPDSVPLERAAITEPTSIAARAVLDRSRVRAGDRVLVEGPGPIGTLTAAIADAVGADVTVSGLGRDVAHRLPVCEELGLRTLDVEQTDLAAFADEHGDGGGFDVVFDATGHHSGVEMAADAVRRGGQVVVVGLPGSESELFLTPLVRGEVDVDTSYGSAHRNFRQALRLIEDGTVDFETLTDSYNLHDPEAAFEDFLAGRTLKPVFTFQKG